MTFIPVPNVAQVEIVAQFQAETVQNVLHYSGGDNTDSAELTNLAGSINLLMETHVAPLMSAGVRGLNVTAIDISQQNGPLVEVLSTWQGAIDEVTDPALPNSIAFSLKKSTGFRGRSFRGRIYHYGFTDSQVTENTVLATPRADIEVAWNQFISVVSGATTWTMQVVSRFANNQPRAAGIATPVIDIASVNAHVDTQRRRLPGHGQ